MTPKIDIIVPVYNKKKYLAKCIRSIQNQTFTDWSLILVDDGSTDGSSEICDRFAAVDSRIAVVHQENRGATSARKTGIANAASDFVAFVDADDLVESEMLQKLWDAQVQYSADIVCCGHKSLSQRGLIKSFDSKNRNILHTSGKEEAFRLASGRPTVDVFLCGKLYRKNLFEKAQKHLSLLPEIFIGDDHAMNTALFDKAEKVVILSDRLYLYRTGGSSLKGTEKAMHDLSELYRFRKNYLLQENAAEEFHKTNLAQTLNVAVCLAHYSDKILSREMICSKLENVIEDINLLHPNYRQKDAFDRKIPMTDEAFKKLYQESVSVRVKQLLLKIF